eukprot:TRINITY_DN47574_c0_g1_i1.p1 TRINITY_DN47574_c0_g1~~TRINITY_DN47574_c0_g1_i1.p1  ORF type:complete len:376 (+),score=168.10 TRINITY_DN47574_c0_g1_i1:66-1193(+)
MNRDGTKTESERILTVLDELLQDLGTLAYCPSTYGDFSHEDLSHVQAQGPHGTHAVQTLSDHFEIERKLEDMRMTGAADASADVASHAHSSRAVVDMLRGAQYGTAYEPSAPPNDSIIRFQKIISTLRGLVHNNFSTTVEEDDQKLQILRDTVSREQHASADVKALQREYTTERKLRQTEVMKKDQAIRKLMEELDDVERKAHEDIAEYTRAAEERQAMEHQKAEQEEQELEEQLNRLEHQLKQLKDGNQKDELAVRGERKRKENNLSITIAEYDKGMTEKTQEINVARANTVKARTELEEIEKEAAIYRMDNAKVAEENEINQRRQQNRAHVQMHIEQSCKMIQAFWRSFAERKIWDRKNQKKKGKGARPPKKK